MRLDEPPSLFTSTPGAPTASVDSEGRGDDRDATGDDELATQPIADLPLFDIEPAAGEASDPGSQTGSREAEDPAPDHATRPVSATASDPASQNVTADETAPLHRRLVASCLDAVALLAVLGLLVGVSVAMGVTVQAADLLLFLPTWLAFGFFYQVLPLLFWGRTPGMTVAGIESRDHDGAPLTLEQATQRWLGGMITWLLLGLPGALALTGRSFVDRLSRSRTVPST